MFPYHKEYGGYSREQRKLHLIADIEDLHAHQGIAPSGATQAQTLKALTFLSFAQLVEWHRQIMAQRVALGLPENV
jgi:hypothetical protein